MREHENRSLELDDYKSEIVIRYIFIRLPLVEGELLLLHLLWLALVKMCLTRS